MYVGAVSLNGKTLDKNFITHEQILQGGELVFRIQTTPNKQWGTSAARPYTQTSYR